MASVTFQQVDSHFVASQAIRLRLTVQLIDRPLETPSVPVVTLVTPLEGPLSESGAIVFDVTDADADLGTVFASITYEGTGLTETIVDADGFTQGFAGASTREVITNGYRYTVRRFGPWPQTRATLKVSALDTSGNLG